uniref:Uncharacterized protein n=1 Tax=Knipowitschia caucasica TaxID=637954 RepID=A0AAV2KLJ9_KNICA
MCLQPQRFVVLRLCLKLFTSQLDMTLFHMLGPGQAAPGHRCGGLEARNITLPVALGRAYLQIAPGWCRGTQDRLKERSACVHWDVSATSPEYSVERVLGHVPWSQAAEVYNSFNKGAFRVSLSEVALRGELSPSSSTAASVNASGVNRSPCGLGRGAQEEQQQVDQGTTRHPGVVSPDGTRPGVVWGRGGRGYGPLFRRDKYEHRLDAFHSGGLSLSLRSLSRRQSDLFSCFLHTLLRDQERRIFRLTVGDPRLQQALDHTAPTSRATTC